MKVVQKSREGIRKRDPKSSEDTLASGKLGLKKKKTLGWVLPTPYFLRKALVWKSAGQIYFSDECDHSKTIFVCDQVFLDTPPHE